MPCFQEALAQPQPWWKIQLFVWEPVRFGTWDGVFTSCMINILGVVLFLRTGWLVVSDELVALEPLLGPGPGKLCHPWVKSLVSTFQYEKADFSGGWKAALQHPHLSDTPKIIFIVNVT